MCCSVQCDVVCSVLSPQMVVVICSLHWDSHQAHQEHTKCSEMHCTVMESTGLQYNVLHFLELHYTALYCTSFYCTALQYNEMHSIALHCYTLNCTAFHCYTLQCTAFKHSALNQSCNNMLVSTAGAMAEYFLDS